SDVCSSDLCIANEAVAIEGRGVEDLLAVQELLAVAHHPGAERDVARTDVIHVPHEVGRVHVGQTADAIAHCAGAEQRNHEKRAAANAPVAERLTEILAVPLQTEV